MEEKGREEERGWYALMSSCEQLSAVREGGGEEVEWRKRVLWKG